MTCGDFPQLIKPNFKQNRAAVFMKYIFVFLWLLLISLAFSCTATRNYSPVKKFPAKDLKADYILLQNILEKKHPSLYWYTSKDSMDMYFARYYNAIGDSMTEQQFTWHILAPLIEKIHCGHTSVSMSKAYSKWAEGKRLPSFPLYMKIWNDTMAVTGSLTRKDSVFKRGTLITAINGVRNTAVINKMFGYLPEDGYASNINYVRLSANFPYYHRNIYGLSKTYQVDYIDSTGHKKTATIPLYVPPSDSTRQNSIRKDSTRNIARPRLTKAQRLARYRSLDMDSTGKMAVMTINTFTKGNLRGFFRRSFKKLKKQKMENLVIDIRSNGGGRVALSTLLTKYISRQPFRIADTLYAVTKNLGPYTQYIKGGFLNNIELFFISKKKEDGHYHIRHLENKLYKPKNTSHYNGSVYVLTTGPTFSAAALFSNVVKGQPGITLLGEETGGGWHGNNGIMIPDITLPNTKTRVRLPLFRLVQYQHVPKTGTGIIPDVYVGTSYDALLKGYDKKMQVVREMIFKKESE
jgi:C-terminal processing protease CtpA/Prc